MSCDNKSFISATSARNIARNNKLIFSEICSIQQAILNAVSSCPGPGAYSVLINGNSPITSSYGIRQVLITNPGSGYSYQVPTVSVAGPGINFVGTVNNNLLTGTITSIGITTPGTGYSLADVVSITHPSGIDFAATVTSVGTLGEITGITITNGGSGYFDLPRVLITDANDGSGFIGEVTLTLGTVTGIEIVESGQNYSNVSTATIVGNGTGATVVLVMDSQKWMEIPYSELFYQVWSGLVVNVEISDQLAYIQQYFTNLGYNFTIRVNPTTMSTLQWQLTW